MKGRELIQITGEEFCSDFSIEDPDRFEVYKNVYENFINGLDISKKEKGVMIIGGKGTGKTLMMRVMHRIFRSTERKFYWLKARELKYMIDEMTLSEILVKYGSGLKVDLYIDDIALETGGQKIYGNYVNVISDLLYDRYELFCSTGIRTHTSSNLPRTVDNNLYPDIMTIEKVCGERVSDRLIELCELHIMDGESLRK